jgi:hydrogenase maturation protease
MQNNPILILAYGNLSRGDDALAPLLLEQVQNFPATLLKKVECLTDFQLQIEHALDLQNRELVLFIDASVANQQPIEFSPLHPAYDNSYTTHAMNPAAVMQVYQDTLKAAPPPCFLLTLQGIEFELGADLSPAAAQSLKLAQGFIRRLLENPTLVEWQKHLDYAMHSSSGTLLQR